MPPKDIYDSKHWRDRAAEMRALAQDMKDPQTTQIMNDLADDYDKLADRAEFRRGGVPPSDRIRERVQIRATSPGSDVRRPYDASGNKREA